VTRAVASALVVVALSAGVWGLLQVGWYSHFQIVDYGVYQTYGDKVVDEHEVPYRDFTLEYPPAALPVFIAPSLVGIDYSRAFQLLMAACFAVCVVATFAIGGARAAAVALVTPLALGSVVISRFDLWPAALAVCCLVALLRERQALSAVLLGTAFAAKLWPAVLAPLLLIWLLRSAGTRAAVRWLGVALATAAVWFVPFLALSPSGVGHAFHEQFARPLQIESLGAAVLLVAHDVGDTSLHMVGSFGSQNLTGPGTHAAAVVTSIAGVVALLLVYAAFLRRQPDAGDLLRYCAAAVAFTIAFGKVFSPQFLIWLLPLVPLVRGRRGIVAGALFLSACVLTQLWFPSHYWDLALHFNSTQAWELLARDVAVVALGFVLVWPALQHEVLGEHRMRVEALKRVRAQVE
jgi:uncharacterized membrane protein